MVWEEGSVDIMDCQKDKWVLEQIKPEAQLQAKMTKKSCLFLWAHHEKAGFSGKDNNAGENRK